MTHKSKPPKRSKHEEPESSELFQNDHTDHNPTLVPHDDVQGSVKPFVRIIGESLKEPKDKKSKRKWAFVDDE